MLFARELNKICPFDQGLLRLFILIQKQLIYCGKIQTWTSIFGKEKVKQILVKN